ncbi:helix-turn-helix transcriptional regulator [Lancefieldella parvula]|uniref:helix-turn-helix transcriptional regulator n=1 Tax=Lancefieldella parvula TaxID=1382 RepID=UPI00288C5D6A|nr:helix-turn-helix transcriptional regulator [Lancefieldella parvula]
MRKYDLQLRALRNKNGLTLAQLAEKVGVTLQVVGNWERGTTEITLGDALKVCRALDCSLDELAGWETSPTIKEQEKRALELQSKIQEVIDEYQQ